MWHPHFLVHAVFTTCLFHHLDPLMEFFYAFFLKKQQQQPLGSHGGFCALPTNAMGLAHLGWWAGSGWGEQRCTGWELSSQGMPVLQCQHGSFRWLFVPAQWQELSHHGEITPLQAMLPPQQQVQDSQLQIHWSKSQFCCSQTSGSFPSSCWKHHSHLLQFRTRRDHFKCPAMP